MANDEKKVLKLGLLSAGGKLTIDNGFLRYQHPYGSRFEVMLKDIQTVTIDMGSFGKSALRIVGAGTELANVTMPTTWAQKCRDWILANK